MAHDLVYYFLHVHHSTSTWQQLVFPITIVETVVWWNFTTFNDSCGHCKHQKCPQNATKAMHCVTIALYYFHETELCNPWFELIFYSAIAIDCANFYTIDRFYRCLFTLRLLINNVLEFGNILTSYVNVFKTNVPLGKTHHNLCIDLTGW